MYEKIENTHKRLYVYIRINIKNTHKIVNTFFKLHELKITDEGDDRNMFKILGQVDWTPVAFHPETPEESILKSKYLFENLPGDHKWTIAPDEQGMYKIIVDLFKNTIIAEYLGDTQL